MENVAQLEPARLQGLFKKLKVEKQNGVFATSSQIHATARRRASDGSIRTKEDLTVVLKEIFLVKFAGFIVDFDVIINDIIPLVLQSMGMLQDNKTKVNLKKEIDDTESKIFEELSPILGLEDKHLVDEKIKAFQEQYYFRATSKGVYIHDIDRIDKPVNQAAFYKQHISPMMYSDNRKLISFGQFVIDNNRLREFEEVVCDPRKPQLIPKSNYKIGRTAYDINTWKGWTYEKEPPLEKPEEHCQYTLKHMKEILANNDEKAYHYLMNYLATWVQTPWVIPGIALFFYGREGCGKDIIVQLLQKIIHPSHIISISDLSFKNDSNWALGRKFVHVREFNRISNTKTVSYINDILESNMIRYRLFFNDPILVENPGFYWISSNIEDAIPAKEDTRRWKIFHCNNRYAFRSNASAEFLEDRVNYLRRIGAEIDGTGPQALYQILKAFPIQDIKELSINSVGLEEMMEANQSALDIFINDLVMQGRVPDYSDMVLPAGMEIAFPSLDTQNETRIEANIIRKAYSMLWKRYDKNGTKPDGRNFSKEFITGLGLPWEEGKEFINKRKHLRSANSSLYYFFPPLPELRQKYMKRRPT